MCALAVVGACDDDDDGNGPIVETFTITVENVSQPGTIATDRAGGAVPLSPGAYGVFSGANPLFTVGTSADAGTELIAEDGFPMTKAASLVGLAGASASGTFTSPGGPDDGDAIFPGESSTFTVTASPGQRLQFELMFVQSNDWFYALGADGIELFDGNAPIDGDVTAQLVLYDAGSEADTAPGTGPDQKPAQDPGATNVGPPDTNTAIRPASQSGFAIPATANVIRVTVSSQ
jgi:hypothetical protein